MTALIETVLLFLAVLVVIAIIARRLNTAPSILLVVAGVVLALIPGLPRLELAPELVLLGILVGAIVPPPDAVAPLAIARRVGLPRRLIVVLEGEGLANDATALILYRFAVAAVSAGVFSLPEAAGEFAVIVVGEIAWGIAVGWASLRLRRWAHDPRVEITMSLMMPYIAFLVPSQLGGSGVLATVAAGLFVSWNGPLLIPAATRLQGIFFWDLLVYFLEGFVFLVTGMQTRTLLNRMDADLLHGLTLTILVTVVVVIVTRFICIYPAIYLPRWLSPALARRDPLPPWQWTFFLGFVGIRGVVSLAAALALPLTTLTAASFPDRDLILFVTFGVIIATLVGQGLTLPAVVRALALPHDAEDERRREQDAEISARLEALKVAQGRLDKLAAGGEADPEALAILRAHHHHRAGQVPENSDDGLKAFAEAAELRADLIGAERKYIYRLLQEGKITDEARRRIERELDLEEESLAFRRASEPDPPL